ncbi:MAG: hypothetical protein CL946_01750 [Ectothiorhodospiraceae bacterium]|nr:hypothetical protein [Ectothiorhodospiraceae bacterium]
MKKWLLTCTIVMMAATGALAQQTTLQYFTQVPNPSRINFGGSAMALVRFETTAPARLNRISMWVNSQGATQADSLFVFVFGREGGGPFPSFLIPLTQRVRLNVNPDFSDFVNIDFQTPLTFSRPTTFYVGVLANNNVTILADGIQQTPSCALSTGDTLWTNSFAIPQQGGGWNFGYTLTNQQGQRLLMYNWYISARVEYFNTTNNTYFTDVTSQAGLTNQPFPNTNRKIAWGDYDGDGFNDMMAGSQLFRNQGNGTFQDVSMSAGYADGGAVNMFADYDNDGDLDIFCMPDNHLYVNENNAFSLNTFTGFQTSVNTEAMAFGLVDDDQFIDFFVVNGEYITIANPNNPSDSALVSGAAWEGRLYVSLDEGDDRSFQDFKNQYFSTLYQEENRGINPFTGQFQYSGYLSGTSAQWIDYDNDGELDLYIGNKSHQRNYLFNKSGGFFQSWAGQKNLAGEAGTEGLYGNTVGFDWGDYDNDGDLDMIGAHVAFPQNLDVSDVTQIWRNNGAPNYDFEMLQGVQETGFGYTDMFHYDAAFGDFNSDGLLDFVLTSGENCFPTRLYMQNPDHTFSEVSYAAGIDAMNSYGTAWVDYDNDGDLDLSIVTHQGVKLYRNDFPTPGNWVQFNLTGETANSHAIGSRVTVFASDGTQYIRDVTAGRGAGSQNPYTLHVGLGTATVDSVQVRWTTEFTESFTDITENTIHNLEEFVEPPDTTVSVTPVTSASSIQLQQNFPNPFSKSKSAVTSIAYNLPSSSAVRVEIYNTTGSLVRVLVDKQQSAGTYYVQWDGLDEVGRPVTSGNYQYVLKTDGKVLTKRMVVIK